MFLLQMTIAQLKSELEKGPQEVAVYTKEIHELKSSLNSLQQQSQVTAHSQILPRIIVVTPSSNYDLGCLYGRSLRGLQTLSLL